MTQKLTMKLIAKAKGKGNNTLTTDSTKVWKTIDRYENIRFVDGENTKEARENGKCFEHKFEGWEHWHPDMLVLSSLYDNVIFDVSVPSTGIHDAFRVYYFKGKNQFCKTLTEKYNERNLV